MPASYEMQSNWVLDLSAEGSESAAVEVSISIARSSIKASWQAAIAPPSTAALAPHLIAVLFGREGVVKIVEVVGLDFDQPAIAIGVITDLLGRFDQGLVAL